jgi:hypothetical protein
MAVHPNRYPYPDGGFAREIDALELEGLQAISAAGFANASAFGAGTVVSGQQITGAGFANANAFGAGTVSGSQQISAAGFANASAFGAGTVVSGQQITGAGFANANAFGAGTVSGSQQISAAGFANASAFGAGTVSHGGITPQEQAGGMLLPLTYRVELCPTPAISSCLYFGTASLCLQSSLRPRITVGCALAAPGRAEAQLSLRLKAPAARWAANSRQSARAWSIDVRQDQLDALTALVLYADRG